MSAADSEGFWPSEEAERSWIEHFREFKEEGYPVFQRHGITLADALILVELNKISSLLSTILENQNEDSA